MRKIMIVVDDQGRVQMQSDLDQLGTLKVLHALVQTTLSEPVQMPAVQQAPAAVLDRLNGHAAKK